MPRWVGFNVTCTASNLCCFPKSVDVERLSQIFDESREKILASDL